MPLQSAICVPRHHLLFGTFIFLTGVSSFAIWPFTSSLVVLYSFIILSGIGCGFFFSLVSPILGQVFRPQNLVRNGSGTIYWNLDIAVFP